MANTLKAYNSPELTLKTFEAKDVICTSDENENLGGIPEGWNGLGGGF